MKTLKLIIAIVALTSFTACNFDINLGQVQGNGNVVTQEREVSDFDQVKGSAGLDVYLTEGSENKPMRTFRKLSKPRSPTENYT